MQGDLSHSIAAAMGARALPLADIAAAIGRPNKPVGLALGRLVMAELAERLDKGVYRLTEEGRARLESGERFVKPGPRGKLTGARRPKAASFCQRAWNAMRIKQQFTIPQIVQLARKVGDRDPANNLHRYFKALENSGFIAAARRMDDGKATSNGVIVWRLLRDTGDIAPAVHRSRKSVFDHNTRERFAWL